MKITTITLIAGQPFQLPGGKYFRLFPPPGAATPYAAYATPILITLLQDGVSVGDINTSVSFGSAKPFDAIVLQAALPIPVNVGISEFAIDSP